MNNQITQVQYIGLASSDHHLYLWSTRKIIKYGIMTRKPTFTWSLLVVSFQVPIHLQWLLVAHLFSRQLFPHTYVRSAQPPCFQRWEETAIARHLLWRLFSSKKMEHWNVLCPILWESREAPMQNWPALQKSASSTNVSPLVAPERMMRLWATLATGADMRDYILCPVLQSKGMFTHSKFTAEFSATEKSLS